MPAFLLLAKVGRVPVPVLWFPLWMILLPLSCLAWLVAGVARLFTESWTVRLMRYAPRAVLALTLTHGMRVEIVSGEKTNFSLTWI